MVRSARISASAIADTPDNSKAVNVNTLPRRRIKPLAPVQNLPGRRVWTEKHRTHLRGHGGVVVYRESMETGHHFTAVFHVVRLAIADGREALGETVDTVLSLNTAVAAANNAAT
jgi:hypothetical protein